jgi:hypothetical protein
MPVPPNVRLKKMANALFPNAEAGGFVRLLMGEGGQLGLGAVQKAMGGLWVGGDAWLTDTHFGFEPNALNRAAHKDADSLSVAIPLSHIRSARDRFGMFTRIIDVGVDGAVFSIRCYGARAFAAAIRQAARIT